MARRKTSKRSKARTMLRLADLEQSKNAVLHSLGAASSQESYGHAIDEFIGWYCSDRGFHSIELLCFAVGGWMTLGEDPCTDLPVNSWIPDRRLADALASGKDNQQK